MQGQHSQQYPPQQYPQQQHPQQYPPQYPPQQYPPQQYPMQQQYPPQYPPQQFPMQPYPQQQQGFLIKRSGYDRLERDGIYIKQRINTLEVITGCVQKNTYYVYPLGKDGDKKGAKMFKCKEESGCCARQCLTGSFRPFKLKVNLEDDNEELDNNPFLVLDRPCACTFLCCNRPEVLVTYVENGANQYLGKIRNPWTCCDDECDIYDKDNNLKYKIVGNCCQLGFWCNAPCESCQTLDFDIKTPSGEVVSTLQKRTKGCLAAMVSDANNFSIPFPNGATKEDKALIMAAVLFIDYRYFNENPKNNGGFGGANQV